MARSFAKLTLLVGVAHAATIAACAAPDARPTQPVARPVPPPASAAEPPPPPPYVIADPPTRSASFFAIPLGPPGAPARDRPRGIILEGLRIVAQGPTLRTAKDVAEQPLVAAYAVPKRMGGGFLFRTRTAVYVSESFDGTLKPVVTTPSDIGDVSFGPKGVLLRGDGGERWHVEIPSGKRLPIAPTGLVDFGALDDGRAVALVEMGRALVSADGGGTWIDVTSQLRARPTDVVVEADALYIGTQSGQAMRVDAGGQLTAFDKAPATKPKEPLRPKDPRWRNDEPPIRKALRLGAPLDEQTALVATDGDVVRVNVVTGEIVAVTPGRLPPDATCDATRTADDVVLVCTRPNGTAFVASHTIGDKLPVVEQTFATTGQFYVGDDGGIAFGGPCTRPKASRLIVCVRAASGGWQEYDLESIVADAGGPPMEVVRWIPRADGSAIGVTGGASWGFVDARSGEARPWPSEVMASAQRAPIQQAMLARKSGAEGLRVADRSWSATASGTVRGWGTGGASGAFEISLDGQVTPSAFSFDRVATAGAFALARGRDGRVWQSLDRGATWVEVLAPIAPRPQGSFDVRACSAVGCDLGAWYRLGWPSSAPAPFDSPGTAPAAPLLKRDGVPQLACKPTAEVKKASLARTERSPEDLGLGMNRVALGDDKGEGAEYLRAVFHRIVPSPVRDGDQANDESAARALTHGYVTTLNDKDKLVTRGPGGDVNALRRAAHFVAPFDVGGVVRKGVVAVSDATAALRASGASGADFLRTDPTTVAAVVPMTPIDAAAPNDLFFACDTGMVGAWRASGAARSRLTFAASRLADARFVSAVALGADDFAALEVDQTGRGRVDRVTASGVVAVFELAAPPVANAYPVNNDALAIGPKGELAVLRINSGGEPSSANDPALLLSPSGVSALAPWSTLTPADDAACKADTGGWRATIQTQLAWVRLSGADTAAMDDTPMLARVRWSAARACLEAIELRAEDVQMIAGAGGVGGGRVRWQPTPWEGPVENWVVAKFVGSPSAGRVGVIPGIELRQPLTCALAAP